jgi:hypothetical protein
MKKGCIEYAHQPSFFKPASVSAERLIAVLKDEESRGKA